jgi:hypothetical protein
MLVALAKADRLTLLTADRALAGPLARWFARTKMAESSAILTA